MSLQFKFWGKVPLLLMASLLLGPWTSASSQSLEPGVERVLKLEVATTDRRVLQSNEIVQQGFGLVPQALTSLVLGEDGLHTTALNGTLIEVDGQSSLPRALFDVEQSFYFSPAVRGKTLAVSSGWLLPEVNLMGLSKSPREARFDFLREVYIVKGLGRLSVLDRDQAEVSWTVEGRFMSKPVLTSEKVVVGSMGSLVAYDLEDGTILWKIEPRRTGGDTVWYAPTEVEGGRVWAFVSPLRISGFLTFRDQGHAYVLGVDANSGKELWRTKLDLIPFSPASGGVTADFFGDRLYAIHADKAYALCPNSGKKLWERPFTTRPDPDETDFADMGPGLNPEIAFDGGMVYVGGTDGNLYALDSQDGTLCWTFAIGASVGAPLYQEGKVYVGSRDKHLYVIEAESGKLLRKFRLGGATLSRPQVLNGLLYCGTETGELLRVNLKEGGLP